MLAEVWQRATAYETSKKVGCWNRNVNAIQSFGTRIDEYASIYVRKCLIRTPNSQDNRFIRLKRNKSKYYSYKLMVIRTIFRSDFGFQFLFLLLGAKSFLLLIRIVLWCRPTLIK